MNKILFWLWFPVAWLHEGIHEVLARKLGIFVRREVDCVHVRFHDVDPWKNMVVLLAPAVIGLVALCFSVIGWIALAETLNQDLFWSCLAWVAFWWIAACGGDIYEVYYFMRYHKWYDIDQNEE